MVGVKFTQHGTCLFFIINFPPLNLVLSFLFKVGMVVYEVAAKKNMIFKIRTCWSWWYKLRKANYKWGKDDALFKTLDIYFMSSVCPFWRKANLLPSTFGSLDCEQRGQSQVTLSLRCRACKGRVVLRHCNRGDSLPPPEQCCEKQVKVVRWEAGPNILLEGKRAHSKKRRLGTPNLILKHDCRCSKILLFWDQSWSVKPHCTQDWS